MIDVHSETWADVKSVLDKEYDKAVKNLIAGIDDEKQRGRIALIQQIQKLSVPDTDINQPQDTY